MATPVNFPEANDRYRGEASQGVNDLPVFRDGARSISCWSLTPEEVMEIVATGKIWMTTWGNVQPPVNLDGVYPFVKSVN